MCSAILGPTKVATGSQPYCIQVIHYPRVYPLSYPTLFIVMVCSIMEQAVQKACLHHIYHISAESPPFKFYIRFVPYCSALSNTTNQIPTHTLIDSKTTNEEGKNHIEWCQPSLYLYLFSPNSDCEYLKWQCSDAPLFLSLAIAVTVSIITEVLLPRLSYFPHHF